MKPMTAVATGSGSVSAIAPAAGRPPGEPKRLVLLPGGHFDAYTTDFEAASDAAADWFTEHLAD